MSRKILHLITLASLLSLTAQAEETAVTLSSDVSVVDAVDIAPSDSSPAPNPTPTPTPTPTPSTSSARSASGIRFSSEVTNDQYAEIAQDLAELSSVPITKPDSKLLSILGLSNASAETLLGWLTERVHFIVDQNYSNPPQTLDDQYSFPNPDIEPVRFGGTNDENEFEVLLSNLGATYYTIAKSNHLLVSVYIPSVGEVTLSSPRAGILKLGSGLFDESVIGVSNAPNLRNARRTIQLATLFHEARHSDGHGEHVTFRHMTCPEGHALAGQQACDANLNGPYSIEAHFLNSVDRSCDQCSVKEHDLIRLAALDDASRVQREIVDPTQDPVAVLRKIQMLESVCDSVTEMEMTSSIPADLAKDCESLPKQKELALKIKAGTYKIPVITSTDWDTTPEGQFDLNADVH